MRTILFSIGMKHKDEFLLHKNSRKLQDDFDPHYNSDIGKYDRSDKISLL